MTVISATSRTCTASSETGLREDRPADHVAERILLAIQAMIGGLDIEPVVMDRRSRMRRREQANHVRGEPDGAVVLVACRVVECDVNGHQSRQHTLARARVVRLASVSQR